MKKKQQVTWRGPVRPWSRTSTTCCCLRQATSKENSVLQEMVIFLLPKENLWNQKLQFSSVQSLSRVRLFATPWIAARQASLSITNSRSSLRLTSIESGMPSSHLTLCRPLLLLPPIPPSIRVFSNESTLRMRWPKYWSFSFSIIPSKEIPGLISFRMDWLDLLAVQWTLKSLLQHHLPLHKEGKSIIKGINEAKIIFFSTDLIYIFLLKVIIVTMNCVVTAYG